MRKRWRWLMVTLAVGLIVGPPLWAAMSQPPRFVQISLDDLFAECEPDERRPTRQELEARLGPPGDYRTGPTQRVVVNVFLPLDYQYAQWEEPAYVLTWESDTRLLRFGFDAGNGLVAIGSACNVRVDQSPLENLVWRVKRQWRRWFP